MRLLPFEYAVRNLSRSPMRLIISVVGSVLIVILAITAFAFVQGMDRSLIGSGSMNNVILLGAGSEESIERSEISPSVATQAQAGIYGIKSKLDQAYISPEVHAALGVSLQKGEEPIGQAVFRGVSLAAFSVHPQVQIIEGRSFQNNADEIIVGQFASTRLGIDEEKLKIGNTLWVDGRELEIVGRFAAPNTVMNAELWIPLSTIQTLTRREKISCVVLTLDQGEFSDVDVFVKSRVDLELVAISEVMYYQQLVAFYQPVKTMIWITAILIGIGALLGGLNTMYAAFVSRIREVGTLQSLGYPRRSIVISFMQESLLASASGAIIGTIVCLVLLDGVSIRFSMGAFALILDGFTIGFGILAGICLGIIGSIPPTLRCFNLPISEALKST